MMLDKDSVKAIDVQTASLQSYIGSPEKQKSLYKRTLFVVSISQIFGGAGLAAGGLSVRLLHSKCLALMRLLVCLLRYLL
ncbi:hypothetical protein Bsub01_02518 [Bacillus subtilis]|nr:putative MFS-type transporter YdeG [Bacillus subtilis]ARV97466.1 putative MFS-type transporter YdeG [Bacillus subtilis subsp. subtilis]ARW01548.1 putative MFS-type transporter YdeG [Bacillus subtilis subsp. subtilis]ASB55947.1 putative MFS-type transporter YdeG [Bacillus subtilis subsp. subtilis]ASB68500.1 putative MFS-type transporter YdeG [Bacillus subtilis subsp. subtilis]